MNINNLNAFFLFKIFYSTLNPTQVSSSVSAVKNTFKVDEFVKIQYKGVYEKWKKSTSGLRNK